MPPRKQRTSRLASAAAAPPATDSPISVEIKCTHNLDRRSVNPDAAAEGVNFDIRAYSGGSTITPFEDRFWLAPGVYTIAMVLHERCRIPGTCQVNTRLSVAHISMCASILPRFPAPSPGMITVAFDEYVVWADRARDLVPRFQCSSCSKTIDDSTRVLCGRCRCHPYCGKSCQRAHWPVHKTTCREPMVPLYNGNSRMFAVPSAQAAIEWLTAIRAYNGTNHRPMPKDLNTAEYRLLEEYNEVPERPAIILAFEWSEEPTAANAVLRAMNRCRLGLPDTPEQCGRNTMALSVTLWCHQMGVEE